MCLPTRVPVINVSLLRMADEVRIKIILLDYKHVRGVQGSFRPEILLGTHRGLCMCIRLPSSFERTTHLGRKKG